jgi:hypothetical protein
MGVFSSKKKTTVGTAVDRVIEEQYLPDIGRESVIQAILEGGSVADYLMEGTLNGVGLKFERMHRYAKKEYFYGLPNDSHQTSQHGQGQIKEVLEAFHGEAVTILYSEVGALNSLHFARETLTQEYAHDEGTNVIGSLTGAGGAPVYVVDVMPLLPAEDAEDDEAGEIEYWGLPGTGGETPDRPGQATLGKYAKHSLYLIDPRYPFHGALVKHAYWQEGVAQEDEFAIEMSEDGLINDYFQVRYQVGTESKVRYWTYRVGEGSYPSLDETVSPRYTEGGTYWPFVVFRREKNNRTAEGRQDTDEYKTTAKMLDYINMDFQTIGDAIHENPDIGDVEQAVMVMAAPAKSQDELDMRYLFEYFKSLYVGQFKARPSLILPPLFGRARNIPANVITLQDADYKMHLSYTGLYLQRRAGRIGKVGTCTNELSTVLRDVVYAEREKNAAGEWITVNKVRPGAVKGRVLRKQVSEAVYEEIVVERLKLRYEIWKGKETSFVADDAELLIPLDKAITDLFSLQEREVLLSRSLHFVFNSRVTTTVKWYERGIFKALLVIAAIVIAFYTGQFYAIQMAIAAGSAYAVAIAVLTVIVKTVGFQLAFKYTAKELGPEVATILAIVAMAVGTGSGIKSGGLENAPWATELLQAGTGLINAVGGEYGSLIEGIQSDYTDLLESQEARTEELETANALLSENTGLSPLTFIEGETPDNFYQRTVHSGNIGALSIDAIHHYATLALKLPEPHDTLEGLSYG